MRGRRQDGSVCSRQWSVDRGQGRAFPMSGGIPDIFIPLAGVDNAGGLGRRNENSGMTIFMTRWDDRVFWRGIWRGGGGWGIIAVEVFSDNNRSNTYERRCDSPFGPPPRKWGG